MTPQFPVNLRHGRGEITGARTPNAVLAAIMGDCVMLLSGFPPEWTRLAEVAKRIELGDSLGELVTGLLEVREAFPMNRYGSMRHPADAVAHFAQAVLSAVCWERFGIDALVSSQAADAYKQAVARGPSADYRSMEAGRLTTDERNTLLLLAGKWLQREQPDAAD